MQEINMDNINIDDYYVSVEYLDNFTDNNIDNWVDNGNKEKIMNKLNQIYKSGRSFTSNGYQATSTDAVFTPFCFQLNGKWIIEYLETRHIFYFPALCDEIVKESVPEKVQNVNKNDDPIQDIVPKKEKTNNSSNNTKKRKLPTEINKEPIKTEIKSPEKKKRKCDQNSNVENMPKENLPKEVLPKENLPKEINKKEEEAVKLERKSPEPNKTKSNGSIDLDTQVNSAENCDSKHVISLETPEITKHKKKSKEKKNRKSELETPQNHQINDNEKQNISNSDLNGEITKKHKKKSKKSVVDEETINETKSLQQTEPVQINEENIISNGNHLNGNPEKKKKKKKSSNEFVKEEKIAEENHSVISPKFEKLSELDAKKQKKHKKRKQEEQEMLEVKKEKIPKKSKKQNVPDNN